MIENAQIRRLTPLECERLQGFPDDWTEGQADSHRYKQMGNAVAVPVAEWVIEGIVEIMNNEQESNEL
jgi:DNA (cytosine-5)-methyltransferase 1